MCELNHTLTWHSYNPILYGISYDPSQQHLQKFKSHQHPCGFIIKLRWRGKSGTKFWIGVRAKKTIWGFFILMKSLKFMKLSLEMSAWCMKMRSDFKIICQSGGKIESSSNWCFLTVYDKISSSFWKKIF